MSLRTDYASITARLNMEIDSVDTVGVHYSGTLWRWYRNWIGNGETIKAKYGQRWFRVSIRQSNIPSLFKLIYVIDLGALPCLVSHRFSPRQRHLFSDRCCEEFELDTPHQRSSVAVWSICCTGCKQKSRKVEVAGMSELFTETSGLYLQTYLDRGNVFISGERLNACLNNRSSSLPETTLMTGIGFYRSNGSAVVTFT